MGRRQTRVYYPRFVEKGAPTTFRCRTEALFGHEERNYGATFSLVFGQNLGEDDNKMEASHPLFLSGSGELGVLHSG